VPGSSSAYRLLPCRGPMGDGVGRHGRRRDRRDQQEATAANLYPPGAWQPHEERLLQSNLFTVARRRVVWLLGCWWPTAPSRERLEGGGAERVAEPPCIPR